ncbi:hypothetical protein [Roseovarius sp.]|uniref:hypothetical protein n=1 Tax=Roseovarius sp. TaxID=1486281 RepID=UPI003B5A7B21
MLKTLSLAIAFLAASVTVSSAQEIIHAIEQGIESRTWNVEGVMSESEIVDILSSQGWSADEASASLSGADEFSLYTRNPAPGVTIYLAVPRDGGPPIEFAPPFINGEFSQSAMLAYYSAEDIQDKIVEVMQAAIDGLCTMRARPQTIRARASAFGVVEVEATWQAAEVCDA